MRVGKSVAATSERDAAADAHADDEADRQRERHDDARVPAHAAHEREFERVTAAHEVLLILSAMGKSL